MYFFVMFTNQNSRLADIYRARAAAAASLEREVVAAAAPVVMMDGMENGADGAFLLMMAGKCHCIRYCYHLAEHSLSCWSRIPFLYQLYGLNLTFLLIATILIST